MADWRTPMMLILTFVAPVTGAGAKDVPLTRAQIETMGIKVADVRQATNEPIAILPGTVVPAMSARLAASVPFAGTVVQVHVLPGQDVKKGDPLLTVTSRELLEAQSQLRQSESDMQSLSANARRARQLVDHNIRSPIVADEADGHVDKQRALIDQHKRTLAIGDIVVREGGLYTVPAPANGKIEDVKVMPGDKVEAMAPAIMLDGSEDLWIEAQVPGDVVEKVREGTKLVVGDGEEATVIAIGHSLSKVTRSASLYARLAGNSALRHGQMVSVSLNRQAPADSLEVPPAAVTWINDQTCVFALKANGFEVVPVTLLGRSTHAATIRGNLKIGQQVAFSGLPQIEMLLVKE